MLVNVDSRLSIPHIFSKENNYIHNHPLNIYLGLNK